jgi:hypothetical protein
MLPIGFLQPPNVKPHYSAGKEKIERNRRSTKQPGCGKGANLTGGGSAADEIKNVESL